MNPLYNVGIRAYRLGAKIVSRRNVKARKMIEGQRRTLATIREKFGESGTCVWVHAASLGEFEQARPLIERIRREYPDKRILLSFFSPSGYEVRKGYDRVDCVVYLPFDTPKNVREFLNAARPEMAIFVKYEFWGNYLQELERRQIPTYIISAIFRPEQAFFKSWGGMFRLMLNRFTRLYLQDDDSRELLESIGVRNTVVCGDTRFDRVTDVMANRCDIAGAEQLRPFIIFGSSWEADEAVYMPWLREHPQVKFIIAPHEFDDERVKRLCESAGSGEVITLSEWERRAGEGLGRFDGSRVRGIVVDSFGKLASLYRYGRVAYVGGGFGAGIHNINEAAVYGMPVVMGPKIAKFKEARDLTSLGGAFVVHDASECERVLDRLYTDDAALHKAGGIAGEYIRRNLGATDRIYKDLFGAK